jgi:hypothetical protein
MWVRVGGADHANSPTESFTAGLPDQRVPGGELKLQRTVGVARFFREQRGATFTSSALMEPMTRAFVTAMEQRAKAQGVPLIHF